MKNQVKQLVSEINRIHQEILESRLEFKSPESVTVDNIYHYRLVLHESINDYLMTANIGLRYFYRVKTRESIKIKHDSKRPINDIFGARIILSESEIDEIMEVLDEWQDELGLKNWYLRDRDGYKGLHIHFLFPWELQIWNKKDLKSNVENHEKFKRRFV